MTSPTPGRPHVWPFPVSKAAEPPIVTMARLIAGMMFEATMGREITFDMEVKGQSGAEIHVICSATQPAVIRIWECKMILVYKSSMPSVAYFYPKGESPKSTYALTLSITERPRTEDVFYYQIATRPGKVLKSFGIAQY